MAVDVEGDCNDDTNVVFCLTVLFPSIGAGWFCCIIVVLTTTALGSNDATPVTFTLEYGSTAGLFAQVYAAVILLFSPSFKVVYLEV